MSIQKIVSDLQQEIERERKALSFLENRKTYMPEGSLNSFSRNENNYYVQKAYVDGIQKSIMLDKNNEEHLDIIKKLMEKKTLVHGIPILRKNIYAMEKCVGKLRPYSPNDFKYGELLGQNYYLDDEVCLREWKKKPECQNPWHPEHVIHDVKSGIKVRSKSEVLIADSLYDHRILNKYETELLLGGKVLFPDFELLHPKLLELVWWEHLGCIDDPGYAYDNIKKLDYYAANGIVLGKNLIVTYETRDRPLTHDMINSKLRQFDLI